MLAKIRIKFDAKSGIEELHADVTYITDAAGNRHLIAWIDGVRLGVVDRDDDGCIFSPA